MAHRLIPILLSAVSIPSYSCLASQGRCLAPICLSIPPPCSQPHCFSSATPRHALPLPFQSFLICTFPSLSSALLYGSVPLPSLSAMTSSLLFHGGSILFFTIACRFCATPSRRVSAQIYATAAQHRSMHFSSGASPVDSIQIHSHTPLREAFPFLSLASLFLASLFPRTSWRILAGLFHTIAGHSTQNYAVALFVVADPFQVFRLYVPVIGQAPVF